MTVYYNAEIIRSIYVVGADPGQPIISYEVTFPSLPGCQSFGSTFEIAYEMAIDALIFWMEHAEPQFIPEPDKPKEGLYQIPYEAK